MENKKENTKAEPKTKSPNKLSRRALMQSAAALAGGTAATVLSPATAILSTAAHAAPPAARAASVPGGTVLSASPRKNIVETDSGKVSGFVRNGIVTFKGMPYGASTAGKNRFMPPAKPAPWPGVRSSLYWGPVSPQAYTSTLDARRGGWQHDEESFMFEWEDGQPSEDCLRINVWTPSINDNKKRPVLMWIHGGGYTSGSDNELRMYDGESLARHGDVVMVSVNHRLGVLGYADLSGYGEQYADSANVGMLDLIAALGWVKTNIFNFGGDPNSVLVFGQSGGGSKIGTLMGMPAAKNLFHRAVIESGSGLRQGTRERSMALSAALLLELGLSKDSIDKIQDFPDEQIVQASLSAQRKLVAANRGRGPAGPGAGGFGFSPVVDGKNIPRHTFDPTAPADSANVPLMVGTVLNEIANSIQMGDATLDAMDMDEMKRRVTAQRGAKADAIIATFQKAHPSATPFELLSRITAMSSRINALTQAERKAALGAAPAYVYWFQWQTPVLDGRPRAFHCSELPFVFYNTDRCAAMTGGGLEALDLSARVADAWVSFARKGDPNHPGLPAWPKYTADKVPTMVFDTKCVAANDPDGDCRKIIAEALAQT
jgi:para-nitrobenzyl esterase